jgi:hypothetical protein
LIRIQDIIPLRALCRCGDQIDIVSIWSQVPRAGTTLFAKWADCGIFNPWLQSGPDAARSIIMQSALLSQATLQDRGIIFGYRDRGPDTDGKKIPFSNQKNGSDVIYILQ